jgi:phenylacetate-coenzyme A ligase PaaK-like adenylate-forming protein
MLDRIFAAHPFYRRLFAKHGIRRADLTNLKDLAKLPVTTKADYISDPQGFRLGGEGAADDDETVIWDIMYTTGSSGAPTPFVSTTYDFANILDLNRNMMRLRGVTESDSVLNLFPLTRYPHGAWIRAMQAPAAYNIPVTAAMPGRENARRGAIVNRLDEVVAVAARSNATILWGVPSYIRRVVGRAQELGARLEKVRLVFVTGEGFGEEARADLIDRLKQLGAKDPRVSISYGATEMQGGMVECAHGAGYHNPAPDQFHFEAVDPETHIPVADGDEGLILLTHLDRRGTVMLRYSLGDVAKLTRARCSQCGALTERLISMPSRVDGLLKIKGRLVNPQTIIELLRSESALSEFQAVVDKESDAPSAMDRLRLRVVAKNDSGLAARIATQVRDAVGVTPIIEFTTSDDPLLAGRGWKAKPIVDLRK